MFEFINVSNESIDINNLHTYIHITYGKWRESYKYFHLVHSECQGSPCRGKSNILVWLGPGCRHSSDTHRYIHNLNNGPVHKRANHVPKAILDRDSNPFLIWKPDINLCEHKALSYQAFETRFGAWFWRLVRPKKKIVMLPSPDQNLKIGSVGQDFFFFFFFSYRERVEFSNIFFKVSKWGKLGAECSQNAYTSHASTFLSQLNTNFSKFFAQIWH